MMEFDRACSRVQSQLSLLVGGELETSTAAEVERHLDLCPVCRAGAEAARDSRALYRAAAIEPELDLGLWPALRERLRAEGILAAPALEPARRPMPLGPLVQPGRVGRAWPAALRRGSIGALAAAAGLILVARLAFGPEEPPALSTPSRPVGAEPRGPLGYAQRSPDEALTPVVNSSSGPNAEPNAEEVLPDPLLADGEAFPGISEESLRPLGRLEPSLAEVALQDAVLLHSLNGRGALRERPPSFVRSVSGEPQVRPAGP